MLDYGILNSDLRLRDSGEADERADFDVVRTDRMRRPGHGSAALDRQLVRPDALDLRAHSHEKMAEVLDVGLARRIAKDRRPLCGDGGRDGILGSRDAGLIEKDVSA